MFSVITNSLSQAISRFITFELGSGNTKRLKKIFSVSLSIQILLSLLVFLLAEVLGVWFLNTHMNIPSDRLSAAVWVMHCSILMFVVNLITVPYNATIIAHEHMEAFAYLSILEAILKLAVAFSIGYAFFDSLKFYAILLLLVTIIVRGAYSLYSIRCFTESRSWPIWDKNLFKEVFSYASWNFIGALSGVLQTQGVNILLNIFFGPVVNAARGIAVQVEGAIQQLANSIVISVNPQIIKSYASNRLEEMHLLLCRGTKFIYFLLFILSIPVIFEADFILGVWLTDVPAHTVSFVRILLLGILVDMSANSLYTGIQATGKIRSFVFLNSGIRLFILPIGYIFLKLGAPAETVFIVQTFFWCVTQIPRLVIVHRLVGLPYRFFFKKAILPIVIVSIVSMAILIPISFSTNHKTWYSVLIMIFISIIVSVLSVFFLGLTTQERTLILSIPNKFFKKRK